nr:hypothetical protein [uncultured Campylobacter sp.]
MHSWASRAKNRYKSTKYQPYDELPSLRQVLKAKILIPLSLKIYYFS